MYSENIVIAHVNEIASRLELNVFPNPIEGSESLQISCNTNIEALEIMDSKGALILRKNALGYSTTVETASWPAGVYTLRIYSQEGITARRIVKQ
jgi:hypothetical protein